jgi:tRNA(Arg) A34 adenosine deaminase TadA
MPGEAERHLLAAIELARRSRANGNHPFGALLVDAKGNVVLEAENTVLTGRDCTGHAEINLMRMASERFDLEFLSRCTLYASTEPCAMCAGAIYWGNVRRVVFALSQDELRRITSSNPENMQLTIRSQEILARGDHKVRLSGPHLLAQARAVHEGFWE